MTSEDCTQPLQGHTILVTGATGFIGGPVAARLGAAGAEVHGLSRREMPATTVPAPIIWHTADLGHRGDTLALVKRVQPDQIIHLASMVSGSRDLSAVVPMFMANTASSVHLLDAAAAHGVKRVLLAGSLEEPDGANPPSSPYAASKAAAHLYGDYYRSTDALEVVTLQIFMVYGPAQPDRSKLVPYVIDTLLDGDIPKVGLGSRPVDWVYVDDVADAIVRCCQIAAAPKDPVPIGTGDLHTVGEVVDHLVNLIAPDRSALFGAAEDRGREEVKRADVGLTDEALGWVPTIPLSEGLWRTVEWHRSTRASEDKA